MALQRTAGSEIWIGAARAGGRITHFKTHAKSGIVDVTAIAHVRRTRDDVGTLEDGFEIAGLMDPDVVESLHETAEMLFSETQERLSPVTLLSGRIQSEDSIEIPEGDFVRLAAEGYVNVDPKEGHLLLYRQSANGASAASTRHWTATGGAPAVRLDRGASPETTGRTLELRVQLESYSEVADPGNVELAVYHSANGTTWTALADSNRSASVRLDDAIDPADPAPVVLEVEVEPATLNRYLSTALTIANGATGTRTATTRFSAALFVS